MVILKSRQAAIPLEPAERPLLQDHNIFHLHPAVQTRWYQRSGSRRQHLVLPSPVLKKHLSRRYHHIKSLSASTMWSLRPQEQILHAVCLQMFKMFRKVEQDNGVCGQSVYPSCTVQLSRGQAASFQALHQVSSGTDAKQQKSIFSP